MTDADYVYDPIKRLVRKYDSAVVKKGGTSVFEIKPPSAAFLPASEPAPRFHRPYIHRWTPERVAALAEAVQGDLKIDAIADDFGTSRGRIIQVLQKHGYPTRRQVPA